MKKILKHTAAVTTCLLLISATMAQASDAFVFDGVSGSGNRLVYEAVSKAAEGGCSSEPHARIANGCKDAIVQAAPSSEAVFGTALTKNEWKALVSAAVNAAKQKAGGSEEPKAASDDAAAKTTAAPEQAAAKPAPASAPAVSAPKKAAPASSKAKQAAKDAGSEPCPVPSAPASAGPANASAANIASGNIEFLAQSASCKRASIDYFNHIFSAYGADLSWPGSSGAPIKITPPSGEAGTGTPPTNTTNPSPTTPPAENGTPAENPGSADNVSFEQQVATLVNEQRAANGLAPLTLSSNLSAVARAKSQDMQSNGYFSHTSPAYGSPFDMLDTFGIRYRTAGENIAKGYTTPQAVVTGWMNSPGHRTNILNPSYTQIGVGYVASGHHWTQLFTG